MNLSRLKLLSIAAGLLAAGAAQAATITVYAQMGGSPTTGTFAAVGKVADTGTTPIVDCLTSGPAGCVVDVPAASIVLRPSSVSNATFVSWTGCASVSSDGNNDCTVNMTGAKTVQAVFAPTLYALQASTYPKKTTADALPYGGRVQVASAPPIDCRSDVGDLGNCLGGVANGATNVAITAVPDAGSKVTSWTGCTPVAGNPNACTIPLMNVQKGVAATFGAANIPVTAQVQGAGKITAALVSGSVTDAMSCGNGDTDCSAQVVPGKSINLTAVAGSGMSFVGWTGGCASPTSTTCALANVTSAKAVTATFKPSNCSSCHSTPPPTHSFGEGTLSCAQCHVGYTNKTVNVPAHIDGLVSWDYGKVSAPADFGLSFEIVGAGIDVNNKPFVDLIARNGDGSAFNIIAAIDAKEFENGSSSRIPRFAFGEILADGSFVTRLAPVANNPYNVPTSSETSAASRYALVSGDTYRYTFSASAQSGLDTTKTFRAVVYGARFFKPGNLQPNVQYPASDFYDFVPGTGTVVAAKEVVSDEACNTCHGALTLHGMRRGVAVCLTCHNPNMALGGSAITSSLPAGRAPKAPSVWDLKNLVHKLHSGQNDPAWGSTFDASHMMMAPSHSGYFESTNAAVHDPGLIRECGLCHDPDTAADAGFAFSRPTRAACGSCHTAVDFATGVGHDGPLAGPQPDDSNCALCHSTGSTRTYHSRFWEPTTNTDFTGLGSFPANGHVFTVEIVGITVASNGRPIVTFDAKLDGAPFDVIKAIEITSTENTTTAKASTDPFGGRLATCAFTVAGPTADYTYPATGGTVSNMGCKTGSTGSVVVNPTLVAVAGTPGRFTISQASGTGAFQGTAAGTFKTGAWTVSYEMMYQRMTMAGTDQVRKPFSANPGFYTLVNSGTDTVPVWKGTGGVGDPLIVRGSGSADDLAYSRRAVVTFDKCNACHVDLGFHSNRGRKGPDYCAMCHNPKLDNGTRARVPASAAYTTAATGTEKVYLPESVSMNVFIHRIHMGAELPSVQDPASASPWVPEPGRIIYGATRSAFVGVTATTAPELADFTNFGMPNPMGRCNQCHIDVGAQQTWALPTTEGLAPVERTYRVCAPVTPSWTAEQWCNNTSTGGMPTTSTALPAAVKVITPPLKATCTSCHDSAGTNAHVDLNTINPMTAGATELCASCHGVDNPFDSLKMHSAIP